MDDRFVLTETDLIEALLQAQEHAGGRGALTVAEIVAQTGLSREIVLVRLRRIKAERGLVCVRVRREALDGRWMVVPAYRLERAASDEVRL